MSYDRQESLGINRNQSVAVVGCGGVGSWIAIQLALAGVERIDIFDGDTVDSTNLNRLPVPESALGQSKSEALAAEIVRLRPSAEVIPHGKFDARIAKVLNEAACWDWVVVSTDNLASRQAAHKFAESIDAKYIEASASEMSASIAACPAEWDTEPETAGYGVHVPIFVGPCIMAAAMACYYVLLKLEPTKVQRIEWNRDEQALKFNSVTDQG